MRAIPSQPAGNHRGQRVLSEPLATEDNTCADYEQRHGKRNGAYQLLAEVYGWFTEGFDTADLLEARVLLDELA